METGEPRREHSQEVESKEKIYERLCEGKPDAFYVLSGGIAKVKLDHEVKYRSGSYTDLDPHGLASGGKARVIAAAELQPYFPESIIVTNSHYEKDAPSHAEVASQELVHYGVPKEKIIIHSESNSTFTELTGLIKMAVDNHWKHVAVVTNEFQIPRAKEMLKQLLAEDEQEIKTTYTKALMEFREESKDYIVRFKQNEPKVTFIAAEEILPHRDKKYRAVIEQARQTDAYRRRIETEERAVGQLRDGTYGKKLEAKVDDIK